MVGQRLRPLRGIAEDYEGQNVLVLGKIEGLGGLFRIEEINPAAVNPNALRRQNHVGGDYGRVLDAAVILLAGIGEGVVLVKRNKQNRRRPVAAGGQVVDLCKASPGLDDVNPLLLIVLCGRARRPASRMASSCSFLI